MIRARTSSLQEVGSPGRMIGHTSEQARNRPAHSAAGQARLVSSVFGLLAVAMPAAGHANPRPLPFSYPYQTLPRDKFEVEQYVDLVLVRVARENDAGTEAVTSVRSILQTELEFGLTSRLEVGWYFAFRQGATAGTPALRFEGVKQRLRYRLADESTWPVDVGLYLEVAEFHDEIEVEEKILLSRRFGPISAVANLWVEQEYYFQTSEWKYIYNPTLGATYEISPNLIVGAEYWGRGRFDDATGPSDLDGTSDAPTGSHHYLGPTVLVQSGELWFSLGAYVRLDSIADDAQVDDPFGKVWIRTIIGIGF